MNLRKSAKGQPCHIRLDGICNGNPETTVLAHLPDGSGTGKMGGKSSDIHGVFACSACHDVLDNRVKHNKHRDWVLLRAYEGQQRTLRFWMDNGYL